MVLQKLYELPDGSSVRYPIVICSDNIDCFKYVRSRSGVPYYRHRPNHYTEDQWLKRCSTLVSSSSHGKNYDPSQDGIPFCYFAYGYEGDPDSLLGQPASQEEKFLSHLDHITHRDEHLAQMSENFAGYDREALNAYYRKYRKERYSSDPAFRERILSSSRKSYRKKHGL